MPAQSMDEPCTIGMVLARGAARIERQVGGWRLCEATLQQYFVVGGTKQGLEKRHVDQNRNEKFANAAERRKKREKKRERER